MTARIRYLVSACFVWLASALGVAAESPEEVVDWIYRSFVQTPTYGITYLSSPENRANYFSPRMVRFFANHQSHGDNLANACIDFGIEVPGQEYDGSEILRTLRLRSEQGADRRIVHAEFQTFGQPARVSYEFIVTNGRWVIDDVAGQGWRLSQIPCQPAQAGSVPPGSQVTGYCFDTGNSKLILELDAQGLGKFAAETWSGIGHSCSISGPVSRIANGWVYNKVWGDGSVCRMELILTPDKGIRFSDPKFSCQSYHCGAGATLSDLEFPRASQVDCAQMPQILN